MKKNLQYLLHCLLLLMSFGVMAQTAREDLLNMNKLYRDAKSYTMNITVKLYQQGTEATPAATYKGAAKMSQGHYYVDMMGRSTILNDRYALVVDRNQKMILLRDASPEQTKALRSMQQAINVDSLLKADKSEISYISNTAKEKRILILNPESGYQRIEISLDPTTLVLKQIVMEPQMDAKEEGQVRKIQVEYSEVQVNQTVDATFFSERPYIQKKGKEFFPTALYKNYKVINEN